MPGHDFSESQLAKLNVSDSISAGVEQLSSGLRVLRLEGKQTCLGTFVLDVSVYIKDLEIQGQGSCRIYSTKPIYVSGPIKWNDGNSSLQLVSAVYVGFDTSNERVKNRLWHEREFRGGTATKLEAEILANVNGLSLPTKGGRHDLIHLAIAAPIVYSDVGGNFRGIIIAETFLGRLGDFHFEFDDTLAQPEMRLFEGFKKPFLVIEP